MGVGVPHFDEDVGPAYRATLARAPPLAASEGLVEWFGRARHAWTLPGVRDFNNPSPHPAFLQGVGSSRAQSRPVR